MDADTEKEEEIIDTDPEDEEAAAEYAPPLDRLLTYGEGQWARPNQWPDYVQELGLGPEHIPDLIRMGTDPNLNTRKPDDLAVWAPLHAWRALGQLRAEAAIEPLLDQLDDVDDDWAGENLPEVYGMIGPVALPTLVAYMDDPGRDISARIRGIRAVKEIGQQHPDSYEQVVDLLLERLREPDEAKEEDELNGFLVSSLTDLKATRALPLILQAYDDDWVSDWIIDRTFVLREFGIITPEEADRQWEEERRERMQAVQRTPPVPGRAPRREEEEEEGEEEDLPPPLTVPGSKTVAEKAKAKANRKMAQQSRKKNKKRK
jgi:hypothetical protein